MRATVIITLLTLLLSACGVKGPLYLPEPEPAAADKPGKSR
ncbi:MAG: LPS translocon maturation chaperone LptM [Pseudomonadota bacterium]